MAWPGTKAQPSLGRRALSLVPCLSLPRLEFRRCSGCCLARTMMLRARLRKNGAATRCHNMFGPCVAALTLGLAPLVYPFARYRQHFPLPVRCSRPWDPQQVRSAELQNACCTAERSACKRSRTLRFTHKSTPKNYSVKAVGRLDTELVMTWQAVTGLGGHFFTSRGLQWWLAISCWHSLEGRSRQ